MALRHNKDKIPLSMIPAHALEEIGKIFAFGAQKYSRNNWRRGLSWNELVDSCLRHISAFQQGQDVDPESKQLHIAHAATNLLMLIEQYETHPELDDRYHEPIKIVLDIDQVMADFVAGYIKYFNIPMNEIDLTNYYFHLDIYENLNSMDIGALEDFYLNHIQPIQQLNLKCKPIAYVTSRPVHSNITSQWLEKHNLPMAPVITVPMCTSKLDALKTLEQKYGKFIFIDDSYMHYEELNQHGICCLLMDQSYNEKYKDIIPRHKYMTLERLNELK